MPWQREQRQWHRCTTLTVGGPGEWLDLDPTNDRAAGEDYVTLAIGRDYSDVSPMRGVIHGGANHRLRVAVTVTPAENDALTSAAPTMTE